MDFLKLKKEQKVRIIRDIPSVDGMLYRDTKVTIDEIGFPDKDIRVKDEVGKIWYINFEDVEGL
tara:strand:+ start:584 stop:775 length:192 start_codon:yes stop_codon:yes gene_type:complete